MDKTKIARINALAKKAKTVGLNERETAERDALRKDYLAIEICKAVCYNKRTAADPGCSRRRLKCLMAIPRYCLDYEFLRKR